MSMTRQQSSTHDQRTRRCAGDVPRASGRGDITVREAGRKGGQRVRELIEKGHEAEGRSGRRH
jgi:hypothetical protein